MSKRLLKLMVILILMGGSATYGFFIHRNHIFPYKQAQQLVDVLRGSAEEPQIAEDLVDPQAGGEEEETLTAPERELFEEINPLYNQTDVEGLITIHTADDVESLRGKLVALLWGEEGMPQRPPDEVEQVAGTQKMQGVARVERLVVKMEFGLDSVAYHYIPEDGNGKLVIWHEGHYDFVHEEYIQQFIDQGYAVLAFCMPLYCENARPVVSVPRLGNIAMEFHDYMVFLDPQNGHPLKFFLEPVVVGLNYIQGEYGYRHITMTGFSGGGWSTTMAAAIDARIQSSFPVAGSYPIFLREYRDRSHYEHQLPEVYTLTNFLELYVMGGYGDERMQMQVVNQYDPCCYAGIKGQVYGEVVAERVSQLGAGSWALYIDPYHEHGISPQVMEQIFYYLNER